MNQMLELFVKDFKAATIKSCNDQLTNSPQKKKEVSTNISQEKELNGNHRTEKCNNEITK